MTREDLFEAIGNLKDGELESNLENNIVGFPKKKAQTGRWIGLAASVVLIAAVALMVPRMFREAGSSNSADYAAKEAFTETLTTAGGADSSEMGLEGTYSTTADGLTEETNQFEASGEESMVTTTAESLSSESAANETDQTVETVLSQEALEDGGLWAYEIFYNFFGLDDSHITAEVQYTTEDGATAVIDASEQSINAVREFLKYLSTSEISSERGSEGEEVQCLVTLILEDGAEVQLGLYGEGRVQILDDSVYAEEEAFWRGRLIEMDKEAYERFIAAFVAE